MTYDDPGFKVVRDLEQVQDISPTIWGYRIGMGHSVLFRCDGSHQIGFGHVVRCLALADELRDSHGCRIVFAVLRDDTAAKMIEGHGYQIIGMDPLRSDFVYGEWLNSAAHAAEAAALVLDVRDELPGETIIRLRGQGVLIVTIDDPTPRRLLADLAFYPPVPQVKNMDWSGFTGRLYAGWEWVVLRKEFADAESVTSRKRRMTGPTKVPGILVTMGGSDPKGMTIKAISALSLLDEKVEVRVVLGPGFAHRKALEDLLDHFPHPYGICENVSNMAEVMAEADLALTSFGVTAYELAAMSVPAIYLCLTEDHVQSASPFENAGMGICLGVVDELIDGTITGSVKLSLNGSNLNRAIMYQARNRIDGRGAVRIAYLIVSVMIKGGYVDEPQMGHNEFVFGQF